MSLLFCETFGWQNHSSPSMLTNALPVCLCLERFTVPCSRSWYFILVSDGPLGHSFILAHWAIGLRVWYLTLANRVKMAIIPFSHHTTSWKWYYSLRFTAVGGYTKGVCPLRVSQAVYISPCTYRVAEMLQNRSKFRVEESSENKILKQQQEVLETFDR